MLQGTHRKEIAVEQKAHIAICSNSQRRHIVDNLFFCCFFDKTIVERIFFREQNKLPCPQILDRHLLFSC